ncbi:MAG: hypothetical protein AAFX92_03335 [Pseudomonadota bacterium]
MLYFIETLFRICYFLDEILAPAIFGKGFEYAAKSTIALRGAAFIAACITFMIGLPILSAAIGIRSIGWVFTLILLVLLLLMIYCAKKMGDLIIKRS